MLQHVIEFAGSQSRLFTAVTKMTTVTAQVHDHMSKTVKDAGSCDMDGTSEVGGDVSGPEGPDELLLEDTDDSWSGSSPTEDESGTGRDDVAGDNDDAMEQQHHDDGNRLPEMSAALLPRRHGWYRFHRAGPHDVPATSCGRSRQPNLGDHHSVGS